MPDLREDYEDGVDDIHDTDVNAWTTDINANTDKLETIEEGADATDATNVAAAGAIMDGDFSTNGLMKRTGAGTYATATAGTDYAGITTAQTLTNTVIATRVVSTTSSATPAIDTDVTDLYEITALATDITSMTASMTGTPVNGQPIMLRITDNGTGRAITWGANWRGIGATLPTTTTANKTLYVGAMWNETDSVSDVLAVGEEA